MDKELGLIPELKENTNKCTYDKTDISRSEFEKKAISTFDDEKDKEMTMDLLKYLRSKIPVDPASKTNILSYFDNLKEIY